MAVYPSQFTTEEKSLKKRYARLQEKKKQLRKLQEKPPSLSAAGFLPSSKPTQKDALTPKEAKEAAKKLLEAGKLTITKKAPTKRTGFKRVGEVPGQSGSKKTTTSSGQASSENPSKPKIRATDVKALYSRFVKASNPADDLERIPKKLETPESSAASQPEVKHSSKACTIFVSVHAPGVPEEALSIAFRRFGDIQTISFNPSKNTAFITFTNPAIAKTAKKEMDRGMIRGCDVHVAAASDENGYVELPPEAAKHPWAQIAAGRPLTDSPVKKPETQRQRHKEIVTYEPDF